METNNQTSASQMPENLSLAMEGEKKTQPGKGNGCLFVIIIIIIIVIISLIVPKSEQSEAIDMQVKAEMFLKKNLKDPGSLEIIEWSPVVKNDNGTLAIRCKYRAKNSFGGYVIENKVFFTDTKGNVVTYMDWLSK